MPETKLASKLVYVLRSTTTYIVAETLVAASQVSICLDSQRKSRGLVSENKRGCVQPRCHQKTILHEPSSRWNWLFVSRIGYVARKELPQKEEDTPSIVLQSHS